MEWSFRKIIKVKCRISSKTLLVPEGKYVVFHHPPYDFDTMDSSVFKSPYAKIEEAWNPEDHGFKFDDRYPTYQRHDPEKYGQAFMRRVMEI